MLAHCVRLIFLFTPASLGLVFGYAAANREHVVEGLNQEDALPLCLLFNVGVPGNGHRPDFTSVVSGASFVSIDQLTAAEVATRIAYGSGKADSQFLHDIATRSVFDFSNFLIDSKRDELTKARIPGFQFDNEAETLQNLLESLQATLDGTESFDWASRLHAKYYSARRLSLEHFNASADSLFAECDSTMSKIITLVNDRFDRTKLQASSLGGDLFLFDEVTTGFLIDVRLRRAALAREEGRYDLAEAHFATARASLGETPIVHRFHVNFRLIAKWAILRQELWTKLDTLDDYLEGSSARERLTKELASGFTDLAEQINKQLATRADLTSDMRQALLSWVFHCRLGGVLTKSTTRLSPGEYRKAEKEAQNLECEVRKSIGQLANRSDVGNSDTLRLLQGNVQGRVADLALFKPRFRASDSSETGDPQLGASKAKEFYTKSLNTYRELGSYNTPVVAGIVRKRWIATLLADENVEISQYPKAIENNLWSNSARAYVATLDTLLEFMELNIEQDANRQANNEFVARRGTLPRIIQDWMTGRSDLRTFEQPKKDLILKRVIERWHAARQQERFGRDEHRVLAWIIEHFQLTEATAIDPSADSFEAASQ